MNTLRDVFGYRDVSSFARACGKSTSNMSRYLRGTLHPGDSVLRTSITHRCEWPVEARGELQRIPSNLNALPTDPGLYVLFDSGASVLYLGKAANLRQEIRQTLRRTVPVSIRFAPHLDKTSRPKLKALATHVPLYAIQSSRLRHNLEALLLRILANQTHNRNFGHFK